MTGSTLRFRFPDSRGPRLLQILELAKAGQCTERTLTRGRLSLTVFQTVFDLTRPDLLAPALSLAQALRDYRGAEVWGNDQPLRFRQVVDVLLCLSAELRSLGLHRALLDPGLARRCRALGRPPMGARPVRLWIG